MSRLLENNHAMTTEMLNLFVMCCSRNWHWKAARDYIVELHKQGVQPDSETFALLMECHERDKTVENISESWRLMKSLGAVPNAQAFIWMLRKLGKYGKNHDVYALEQSAEVHGVYKDLRVFTSFLSTYNAVGEWKQTLKLWRTRLADKLEVDEMCY
eukprot:UN23000